VTQVTGIDPRPPRYWIYAGIARLRSWTWALLLGSALFVTKSSAGVMNNTNNSCLLILIWVRSENFAFKVLGLASRQLPQEDWQHRYVVRPLLLETLRRKTH